jgi:L,D-transpeptidase catalytic domain
MAGGIPPSGPEMRTAAAYLVALSLLSGTPAVAEQGGHIASPIALSRTDSDIQLLWGRLRNGLPAELYKNFDLFIYVNKAEEGPWAQHLYAFAKPGSLNPDAEMILMLDAPASTGRETIERAKNGQRVSTSTPAGLYQFDPKRFFVEHESLQWQEDMPNAMFFDWDNKGAQTGLAIHGVTEPKAVAALGHRASAGCIQLSLAASRKLFDIVAGNFEGDVPRFTYDKKTRTTNNRGELARDAKGKVVITHGYRALVIIEDLPAGPLTSQLVIGPDAPAGEVKTASALPGRKVAVTKD